MPFPDISQGVSNMSIMRVLVLLLFITAASAETEGHMPELIQQVTQIKAAPLQLYVDQLPQTTKIYAYNKPSITIGMYQKKQKFHRDLPPTPIFAYGTGPIVASFPGPTIEAHRYTPTTITWETHLPKSHILPWDKQIPTALPYEGIPTVVHLHGGVVSPGDDGHANAWYTAIYAQIGSTFSRRSYYYPNVQHSGNLMYHDHALGLTRINLLAGLLGAYVIREPALENYLNLPKDDEFDRHLIIADRQFSSNGSIYMNPVGVIPSLHPSWRPEYFGDAITVNGKVWPFLNVQRRKYRFRIINASNARYYSLSFSTDGGYSSYPFYVIGSDSSYLSAPVYTSSIVLSVAEIFDVVFDFSVVAGNQIELMNFAPYPYPSGNPPSGSLGRVMLFKISPWRVNDPSTVPPTLVPYPPALASEASVTRWLGLYEYTDATGATTTLLINGKKLTDPVTEIPRSGSTELWNVINLTPDNHPLHIHLAQFQTVATQPVLDLPNFTSCMMTKYDPLQCNLNLGASISVPEYEKTWKNVVKLPPGYVTSVVVKFYLVDSGTPYPFDATAWPGYVYHCHILDHEDNEMIRPLWLTY